MRSGLADPRSSRWLAPLEPWLHASHRYLLPASGAAGLAIGGAIVLGSGASIEPYAGVALVAGGTTALVASLAHRRALARADGRAPSRSVPSRARPTLSARAFPSPGDARLPAAASSRSPIDGLTGGRAPSFPPVLLSSSKPSDQIWSAWVPAGLEALGTELVGPVPETAYVAREADALDPYRERAPPLTIDLPEDGDGPPEGPTASTPWSPPELLRGGLDVDDRGEVAREALTAVPPHLRTSPPPPPRPPAAPRPSLPPEGFAPPQPPMSPISVDPDDSSPALSDPDARPTPISADLPITPPDPTASASPARPRPGLFGPEPDAWRPHPIARPALHHACPCRAGSAPGGRGPSAVGLASGTVVV